MSAAQNRHPELLKLLEAACEDRLSGEQSVRLEELLTGNDSARKLYREYMVLHGLLYWDTAVSSESTAELAQFSQQSPEPVKRYSTQALSTPRRLQRTSWTVGVVAVMALIVGVLLTGDPAPGPQPSPSETLANTVESSTDQTPQTPPEKTPVGNGTRKPAIIQAVVGLKPQKSNSTDHADNPATVAEISAEQSTGKTISAGASNATILTFVNTELRSSWDANQIVPSPQADDAEWLRRVHLDLIGQIPTVDEASRFLASKDALKREKLVETLLQRSEYITNWSTIWANLMVGRTPDRAEYREALTKFLRDSFRENRPWDKIVASVISAEGSTQDNLASGFLLAHVNNQAVPATAIASRLFLGTNVQCTQCHDHPFNDSKQNQFWELNSFFKQTAKVVERHRDPTTGNMLQTVSLVTKPDADGPTFFENRQGRVQPAFPIYNGVKINDDASTNRRVELAKLLSAGEKPQIAEAFVNRAWKHFFGFGFTNPVDDMGPHNPASHPELLDRLAREFVASGYDQKRLMKW
ncbi:DUF1549 and DUF1553 domain-containing protein, partial [Planctomycetaceae bacterium]|nr:DUF1549 and DUF1553 domain-containing protein [Planctomycetaceae bacterium]